MPIWVSLLTDEVSPVLADGLRMAREEGLTTVDIRSIGGINFMSLDRATQQAAARDIRSAGLAVGALATPLLKWPAPGQIATIKGDQFGFDRNGRSDAELYAEAFRCAEILGTRDIRVFSLLRHDGFRLTELDADIAALAALAERHDCRLHIENEHVCNIATIADLTAAMQRWGSPRVRALLDIPNAWRTLRPSVDDIEALAPFVDLVHFKDWSPAAGRMVALGEGEIPFRMLLDPVYREAKARNIGFVVETHVPSEPMAATLRSVRALKLLAAAV